MLNQIFDYETSKKRHFLRLLGASSLSYYGALFVAHYTLYLLFAGYITIRVQFWENDRFNKILYVMSRVIGGFSIIPLVYLMGHAFKGFRNAEMYTILVLYFACWLFYMGFVVWIMPIY